MSFAKKIIPFLLLVSACAVEPPMEVQTEHDIVKTPTTECNIYSDNPCRGARVAEANSPAEAKVKVNELYNHYDNILWVVPSLHPSNMEKPDPVTEEYDDISTVYVDPPEGALESMLEQNKQLEKDLQELANNFLESTDCRLSNGKKMKKGETDWFYKEAEVPYGSTCSNRIRRTCGSDNVVSGNNDYVHRSCQVEEGKSCMINTTSTGSAFETPLFLKDGEYLCYENGKKQSCENGRMELGWSGESCTAFSSNKRSCSFNGRTVQHGEVVKAYNISDNQLASDGSPLWCADGNNSQHRVCNDGTLEGDFEFMFDRCGGTQRSSQRTEIEVPILNFELIENSRNSERILYDYSSCPDWSDNKFFPRTAGYIDPSAFAPTNRQIHDNYPIAQCKSVCFDGLSYISSQECHSCETSKYPDHCVTKRYNFSFETKERTPVYGE